MDDDDAANRAVRTVRTDHPGAKLKDQGSRLPDRQEVSYIGPDERSETSFCLRQPPLARLLEDPAKPSTSR